MELQDSGNLALLGDNGRILWQSFSHPTDTLLLNQEFFEGMQLKSAPNHNNLSQYLEIKSGNLVLYAGYKTPQIYWSIANDSRISSNNVSGKVYSASLMSNSWNFYDQRGALLWQFTFSNHFEPNAMWAAVLGSDGSISFYNFQMGNSVTPEANRIPQSSCSIPEPCNPYYVCYLSNQCQCPSVLSLQLKCNPQIISTCNSSKGSGDLLYVLSNGSNGDGGQSPARGKSREVSHILIIVIIVTATILVIVGLIFLAFYYDRKNKILLEPSQDDLEDDTLLDSLSGMPVRFSYSDLHEATNNFSIKLGEGGFCSVYLGVFPDGTLLAVKQLEAIGQGMKEFRAEVGLIGSIHHVHLVQLKGFCAEGPHLLLVYEYLGKGSLDIWIFKNNEGDPMLDWNTRFNIAVGTAKGLAYLHEECEVKIVHCDIKPENVLLDDNFSAKVSDFGLAKLMDRKQSLVCTQLRGTRGYLAPEWIFDHAISEKSDVYSYGMLLLEIIGGRKNYDPRQSSDKVYLPTYAFKMREEEKLKEILDPKLETDENDERVITAIKVVLWCIQEDMHLRPAMTKVVQMLEGHCSVPQPPTSSKLDSRSSFAKSNSEASNSTSRMKNYYSDAHLSSVQLSGPS
nr:g-type lectin s-receptor-like serine/threonine-protein kinase sd2-5 [Quercus suber]